MVKYFVEGELWHRRLGHIPMSVIRKIDMFSNKRNFMLQYCNICPLARQIRLPFPTSNNRSLQCFELVHMDVWRPYKVETHNNMRFFLTLVDDCSRWTWVYLIHLKSDVSNILKQFLKMIKTQLEVQVKVSNQTMVECGVFFNTQVNELFAFQGILHQSSCPHIAQ